MIEANCRQSEVLAFLAGPALRPDKVVETQAAVIFLTASRAWKIKKSLSLGFLDFSTSERRHAALQAELELNRRTAPDLYLALHAVTRKTDGFAIDGAGEVVDWLLEMRRFPDDALLEHAAVEGTIAIDTIVDLADLLVRFHGSLPPARPGNATEALTKVIDGNVDRLRAVGLILPGTSWQPLIRRQRALLDIASPLLIRRGVRGRVRRGHGDLHLQNIALIEGRAVPFDCLEFSEALATVDVLYDIAFLAMDLWRVGCRIHANVLVNRYLDLSAEDEDGAALLPLFLSLRATIRAHVEATRAGQAEGPAADAARNFLRLAGELIEPEPVCLVAIGGLSGTGKSSVARALGARLGAPPGARILRSDVLRKRHAGLLPEQRLPRSNYTAQAARANYKAMLHLAERHLSAGVAVIADAAFHKAWQRAGAAAVAERTAVKFVGLWLLADPETRLARVRVRHRDASDADEAVARDQPACLPGGAEQWALIDANDTLVETIASADATIGAMLANGHDNRPV